MESLTARAALGAFDGIGMTRRVCRRSGALGLEGASGAQGRSRFFTEPQRFDGAFGTRRILGDSREPEGLEGALKGLEGA